MGTQVMRVISPWDEVKAPSLLGADYSNYFPLVSDAKRDMDKNFQVPPSQTGAPHQGEWTMHPWFAALREPKTKKLTRSRAPPAYQDENLSAAISAAFSKQEPPGKHYYAAKKDNESTAPYFPQKGLVDKNSTISRFTGDEWNKNLSFKPARAKESGDAPFIAAIRAFPTENDITPVNTHAISPTAAPDVSPISPTSQPIYQSIVMDDPPSPISEKDLPKPLSGATNEQGLDLTAPKDVEACDGEDLMGAIRFSLGRPQVPTRNNARRGPKLDSVLDGPFDPTRFLRGEQHTPDATPISPKSHFRKQSVDENISRALNLSVSQVTLTNIPLHEWPLPESVECSVCTDMFQPCDIAAGRIGSGCDHSAPEIAHQYICKGCLEHHLAVQLDQSGADRLGCPLCFAELTYSDIKQWASRETFARYDTLRMRNTVSSDPNFIWCSNPHCGAGQVHATGAEAPIVICQSCGTKTCFRHQQRWHEGLTCAEFDDPNAVEERQRRDQAEMEAIERQQREEERRIRLQLQKDEVMARRMAAENERQDEERRKQAELYRQQLQEVEERRRREQEEEAVRQRKAAQEEENRRLKAQRDERARRLAEEKQGEEAVFRLTKMCPGPNCSYRIEKVDGCKHMTCSRCQHEWCWICGITWIKGHLNDNC